ncbi:MAG: hypothetical protein IJV40_11695 [Oscillospiraceae bacterium]|nr:hypothetical protein [Oscillospiraceae bacterium]
MKKTAFRLITVLLALLILNSAMAAGFAEETAPASTQQEDTGIIDGAALTQWADAFAKEHELDVAYRDFSIGFCYTGTGDSWYYDADTWMYSASMYKVPVAMLLAEKVASGELTQQSVVNGTTVEFLESTALVYSNNDSGHSMVSYLGGTYAGKCSDMTEKFTDLPADYYSSDFIDVSYYTARYMTKVMKTLYDGGEEKFPHVIEYLLQAQPGAYYKRIPEMENTYQIAQKFGAYEEPNGNNNNHCTAIIYTPTPIVVTVMTRNVMDYQNVIALVGQHLAEYALELDRKAEELKRAEEERAAAEAAAAAAAAAAESAAADAAAPEAGSADGMPADGTADTGVAAQSAVSSASTQELSAGESTQRKIPSAVIIIAAVLVLVIVAAAVLFILGRQRAAYEVDPEEEFFGREAEAEDEAFEEEEPVAPAPKKTKKRPTSGGGYQPRH